MSILLGHSPRAFCLRSADRRARQPHHQRSLSTAAEKGLTIRSATLSARLLCNFPQVTASTSRLNQQPVTKIHRAPAKVEGLAGLSVVGDYCQKQIHNS